MALQVGFLDGRCQGMGLVLETGGVADYPGATQLDPEATGGAHLLGTKGVVVIAHGSSSRRAVANAIQMAAEGAEQGLAQRIAAGLAALDS